MSKFAKIIELDNEEQVLLTLIYNNEDDMYEIRIRTDIRKFVVAITLSFETEEKAARVLKEYNKEDAEKYRLQASNLV